MRRLPTGSSVGYLFCQTSGSVKLNTCFSAFWGNDSLNLLEADLKAHIGRVVSVLWDFILAPIRNLSETPCEKVKTAASALEQIEADIATVIFWISQSAVGTQRSPFHDLT